MAVDTAAALRKLQSGQTLTAAEKDALGIKTQVINPPAKVDPLQAYVDNSAKRIAELEALSVELQSKSATPLKPINQMTPAELEAYQKARVAAQTTARVTGNGTQPPYEAGPNEYWSFIGGQWKLYKKSVVSSGGGTVGGGTPQGSPGAAWIWNGSAWVKPPMPQDGKTYTWDNNKGWVISDINTGPTKEQVDAIAAIGALLSSYGVGDLTDAITNAVKKGYSADTIQLIMQDPNSNDPLAVAFQKRFPANKARLAAGKAVLSAAEYLAAERTYAQVFQSYGLGSKATRDYFNKFIEGDVSAAEVSDRISIAVNRVQNADATVKKALAEYYPMLNQSDIVGALLDPKEGLPALQRKIQTAEIGGAALQQGLQLGLAATAQSLGASALADLGITQAQARAGFENIAGVLPRAEFLSSITTGDDYGRLQAEQEQFQGLASAKRARERLVSEEVSRFAGQAGTTKVSLAKPTQGAFQNP